MSDFFKTVKGVSQGIYREKMSRFLAFAEPVSRAEEARDVIKRYANEYHDARHCCWAYMIGTERNEYLSSDNGEPSGTAGPNSASSCTRRNRAGGAVPRRAKSR